MGQWSIGANEIWGQWSAGVMEYGTMEHWGQWGIEINRIWGQESIRVDGALGPGEHWG